MRGIPICSGSGARGTFWNIRAARALAYSPADFGPPSMNLVALETTQPSETSLEGKWFGTINPTVVQALSSPPAIAA